MGMVPDFLVVQGGVPDLPTFNDWTGGALAACCPGWHRPLVAEESKSWGVGGAAGSGTGIWPFVSGWYDSIPPGTIARITGCERALHGRSMMKSQRSAVGWCRFGDGGICVGHGPSGRERGHWFQRASLSPSLPVLPSRSILPSLPISSVRWSSGGVRKAGPGVRRTGVCPTGTGIRAAGARLRAAAASPGLHTTGPDLLRAARPVPTAGSHVFAAGPDLRTAGPDLRTARAVPTSGSDVFAAGPRPSADLSDSVRVNGPGRTVTAWRR